MDEYPDPATQMLVGLTSPVTSFVRTLLRLLESGTAKPHLKHVTELFSFLLDFTKLGDQEAEFLLTIQAITSCVEFYLKTIGGLDPEVDISDDEEEEEDIITLPLVGVDMNASRTASLDKMITLIAVLVEKSRGPDNLIHLHPTTLNSLTCGKFPIFLYNITKENINIRQTCNLIFSLTRHNPSLAESVAEMVFLGVKNQEHSIHFFKLLTLLTELSGGPAGLPCYTTLIMCRVWDLAKACPQAALDWLSIQVTRNKHAQTWLLSSMGDWVQQYLIGHCHGKVRNSAAFLLVSLVPSLHFRQTFRTPRGTGLQIRESVESNDGIHIVHRLLDFLLSLLKTCKHYIDINIHGSNKLVSYFQVMNHLLLGKPEKLLLGKYFQDLWCLFHPKLSEPSIPVHPNKQALLQFWYSSLVDCRENIQLVLSNPQVVRNLAFNYILADHEDAEVVAFNRTMLPIYYGILRMCCAENRSFCRSLAQHQNIQWAFKNISPYSTQYTAAVDELMKLVEEFVKRFPDSTEQEIREIRLFKTQTLQLYLGILDGRSSSVTLISALRILLETAEDRVFAVCHNALSLIFDAFNILHLMHHEATACHVTQEIRELLNIFLDLIRTVRSSSKSPELHAVTSRWKEMPEMTSRLVTLCNSFTPSELKETSLSCLKEMLLLWPKEMLCHMVPMFHRSHIASSETDSSMIGPFFPRRHRRNLPAKAVRPPRPMLQLTVPASQLEASHGQDPEYDKALHRYFWSFHHLVDLMVRVAVNEESVTKPLIDLSAIVGFDGVPLHFMLFPKLWLDIYNSKNIEESTLNNSINLLVESTAFMEYVDAVLLDERSCLNNQYVFQFLVIFFPKVSAQVLNDQVNHVLSSVRSLLDHAHTLDLNNLQAVKGAVGDVRALQLVTGTEGFSGKHLLPSLLILRERVNRHTNTSPVKQTPVDQGTLGGQGASGPKEQGLGVQSSLESQDEKGEKEKYPLESDCMKKEKGEKEKYPLESDCMKKEKEEKAGPSRKRGNEKLMDTLQILFSSCDSLINQLQKQVEEEQEEEKEESTKSNEHSSSPAGPDQTK
ncbi:ubiquitin carboxyl-terminal hydrolase 34 [Eurytemora carolleeae]|uniref:ubiquitin carboxyl-terminal hydrolase 34 n=1 Tax=Eurytemora carolleeae TaxID=1294199 RepID=UPI000C773D1B|nr:ubiquitin carboxyl-terminal hydrolase 34 [Eurytemora carolleeae]|eukprot:XP_023337043.1 ubiquitin carboxyl-terminal hydrolase 34-like [Eurytemora affinis]